MTKLEIGDTPLKPVLLNLDKRVTLGAGKGAPMEQSDRIALGLPTYLALDPATVDEESRVFLAARPNSSFWLLALTCSFRAIDDEPIESAWLEVRLRTIKPEGAAEPAAWSMEPLALVDPVEVSRITRLDASLKLSSEIVPVEIGPSASWETTHTFTQRRPYVEAHREGTALPSWIFTRTSVTEVRGIHRLRMVVELPAGATGQAEVSVGATLRLKFLGLISYRATLDYVPERRIVLLAG